MQRYPITQKVFVTSSHKCSLYLIQMLYLAKVNKSNT